MVRCSTCQRLDAGGRADGVGRRGGSVCGSACVVGVVSVWVWSGLSLRRGTAVVGECADRADRCADRGVSRRAGCGRPGPTPSSAWFWRRVAGRMSLRRGTSGVGDDSAGRRRRGAPVRGRVKIAGRRDARESIADPRRLPADPPERRARRAGEPVRRSPGPSDPPAIDLPPQGVRDDLGWSSPAPRHSDLLAAAHHVGDRQRCVCRGEHVDEQAPEVETSDAAANGWCVHTAGKTAGPAIRHAVPGIAPRRV